MVAIRPETEVDRTQAAVAAAGLKLPLLRGDVEVRVSREAASSTVGQRLVTLLVNELARMKGVVARVHVVGLADGDPILPGTPLRGRALVDGLQQLVHGLNVPDSPYRAELELKPAREPAARVLVGGFAGAANGVVLGADGWRALVGRYAELADWHAAPPYGAGMAASLGAVEAYKHLLLANGIDEPSRRLLTNLAFSLFNYGTDELAEPGPPVDVLVLDDLAIVGCGAGGTAALYTLGMQPGLAGHAALIEPGTHKLSNLNRYLMTTAAAVHEPRHKLGSTVHHLATFAPRLSVTTHARAWELVDDRPWPLVISTVDTVEARWSIQARSRPGATILDGAVSGLLYNVLRVMPCGWCLECKHPYDPSLSLKQRAARWGQDTETIRAWAAVDRPVDAAMLATLARTQNRRVEDFAELEGKPFSETPRLLECGETAMTTVVPSQAPVLPLATTPVGVILAAEIAKHFTHPEAALRNWTAQDLDRSPDRPWTKYRSASAECPRHHHPRDRPNA